MQHGEESDRKPTLTQPCKLFTNLVSRKASQNTQHGNGQQQQKATFGSTPVSQGQVSVGTGSRKLDS